MRTRDQILADYRAGLITRGEAVAAIVRLVTPDNVGQIMSELPAGFSREVTRRASENSARSTVVLGANLSDSEAGEAARSYQIASETIRRWMAREPPPIER